MKDGESVSQSLLWNSMAVWKRVSLSEYPLHRGHLIVAVVWERDAQVVKSATKNLRSFARDSITLESEDAPIVSLCEY
jgi:hypothetical protein